MKQKLTLTTLLVLFSAFYLQAQTSKVNVTIDGPGVVDEYYLLGADGSKQLKLKAVPSKFLGDVTFDGWSGDATGTATELTVAADKAQNIHAKFTYHRPVKKYPLLNLKQSWADMGKPMYYEMPSIWETQDQTLWRGTNYLPVDYNRDGYIDYVQFPKLGGMGTDNHRENVRFWLGKPDGSFEEDPKNDNRMEGTVYSIEVKYADFNDDGYPDFCSFSTGYDRKGSTGDYPVVLMSDENCVYHDLRFPAYRDPVNTVYGCFHGGTTGDFDNDGDIDILFWNQNDGSGSTSLYLENDGKGNFTEKKGADIIDMTVLIEAMPDKIAPLYLDCEVIDLNNDGYNDLIMCGHDHDLAGVVGYCCPPIVFWGSVSGKFGGANYSFLPKPRLGYGISVAMAFYDLNGDGLKEIIVNKNGDGIWGDSRFYIGGYFQICEWENGEYVDKTEHYIPVEYKAFNKECSESRITIENIDGTDYLVAYEIDGISRPGVGIGSYTPYAIRNGVLESLETDLKTKISSFDEGLPIYVDGPHLTDTRIYADGVNPVDTMAAHQWVGISDWDSTTGNMWRINLHHRKDTHFGRTCIRWNRDGQDPNKQLEWQTVTFGFVSEVDIKKLADAGYYLECYIKNTDPELTLRLGFEWHSPDYQPDSFRGRYAELSKKYVEGGVFTGEWQRVQIPLSAFVGNGDMSSFLDFVIRTDKGDLKNEFYLDDIRIRKLPDSGVNDYDRAFMMGYLDNSYMLKERTKQVGSQEFKAMLKPLIQQFAPDSMTYFNNYITDYDVPLTRGMAVCMAYYVARSIGAETNSPVGEQPTDIWDANFAHFDQLLPHYQDPGEEDAPEDMFWRSTVFGGSMTAFYWNFCHVSDHSGINVIALDKKANEFHWDQAFTWEDAVCAITRLLDSIDPNIVQEALVPVTVTAKSYTIKYGDALPKFEYTSEGATLKGTPEITCEATGQSPAGTYPIVITRGSITNYNVTFINGTLTIEPIEIKPISESEEMSFKEAIGNETDLENTVIDNTYYNLDATNGDGYDATEQALVLNSTTSSTQMSAIQGAQVGDAAVRENFSGIIFELPAGKGVVTVDAKTIGTHVLNVQIGNSTPTQVKKSERGTVEVEYNVSAPTYVYLYASTESGASARLYRGPSAGANSVLLYGYKVQVGGTGIEELKNGKMEELKYYDLNGRKVKTPKKGVYIINGKKVIVK